LKDGYTRFIDCRGETVAAPPTAQGSTSRSIAAMAHGSASGA